MRLSKSFLILALLMVAVSPKLTQAQLNDSVFIEHVNAMPGDTVEVKVRVFNSDTVWGITLPIVYNGTGVTLLSGVAEPRANTSIFQVFAENIPGDTLTTQTGLYGFISFVAGMLPGDGDILTLTFEIDILAPDQIVIIDTIFLLPANVLVFDPLLGASSFPYFQAGSITVGTVGIGDGLGLKPDAYALDQNFPNPFNADTKISFALPKADRVKLIVLNVLGQHVTTLVDGLLEANQHDIIWDGTNSQGTPVASGTYFYRLEIGDVYEKTLRMTLLK